MAMLGEMQVDNLIVTLGRGDPTAGDERHNTMEIGFCVRGHVMVIHGGTLFQHHPGQMGITWGAIPHRVVEADETSQSYSVQISLRQMLDWRLPGPMTQALLDGRIILYPPGVYAYDDLKLMQTWHEDHNSGDPVRQKTVELEVEARMRRWSMWLDKQDKEHDTVVVASPHPEQGIEKVSLMAKFIAEHYAEPITVEDVAHAAFTHRSHAMRLFRQVLGTSIVHYIARHRVANARRLLATTDRKILDIAMDSGFGSPARFYSVFPRICGQSPATYRKHFADVKR